MIESELLSAASQTNKKKGVSFEPLMNEMIGRDVTFQYCTQHKDHPWEPNDLPTKSENNLQEEKKK